MKLINLLFILFSIALIILGFYFKVTLPETNPKDILVLITLGTIMFIISLTSYFNNKKFFKDEF
jgi:drug/metabolite transporter (DMT)-like permease